MVALLAVQIIIVLANTFTVSKSSLENCHCHLHNATLTLMNNRLQFVEDFSVHHYRRLSAVTSNKKQATASESSKRGGPTPHVLVKGISRCFGTCRDNVNLVCRPSVTSLKTVTVNVPWTGTSDVGNFNSHHHGGGSFAAGNTLKLSMAVEEHKSCLCVDPNSINVTYSLEQRLRRKINADEEAKLNREIRSVAPTSANNDVITTRATYGTVNVIFNEDGLEREIGPDGIKPTEHEIVYYKTCLACREQQELCQVNGQIYDAEVCHCVYAASRTFLNSFYTLGVVMLTVMVCCFLVFGVQKGDENVLNSSRRSALEEAFGNETAAAAENQPSSTRRQGSTRRCSVHHRTDRANSRHYTTTSISLERNDCAGLNGRSEPNRTASIHSNVEQQQPPIIVANSSVAAVTTVVERASDNATSQPQGENSIVTNAEIS